MPSYGQTFFTIKKAVARLVDDLIDAGTASAGSATTLDDAVRFTDPTDSRLNGVQVYIGNGAGQSRETRATAFTPASDRITIPSGTALDSTSEYMLTRRFSQSDILNAIRLTLWRYGKYGLNYNDQSLLAGCPLVNATFYDNSGTFPNGWTRTGTGGTFARESTVSKHGRYSASILSNGTDAAGIRQDVPNAGLYRGKSVRAKAWLFTNTTARVEFLIEDGIDTTTGLLTVTGTNRGWGAAIAETPSLTVSDRASRLRISVGITAGSAVTVYVSGVYIDGGGPYWREWDIPAGAPTAIEYLGVEEALEGPLADRIYPPGFEILGETTRRLRLNATPPLGSILHVVGRTKWADHATAASDDDTTFDGSAEGLAAAAAAMLLITKGDGSEGDQLRIGNLRAIAAEHGFNASAVLLPRGAVKVERD